MDNEATKSTTENESQTLISGIKKKISELKNRLDTILFSEKEGSAEGESAPQSLLMRDLEKINESLLDILSRINL